MRAARSHRLALALLWLVPLVWSSNYLIARAASGVVPPHVLAFGRWAIVFVVLLCYCWRSLLAHRKRFNPLLSAHQPMACLKVPRRAQ